MPVVISPFGILTCSSLPPLSPDVGVADVSCSVCRLTLRLCESICVTSAGGRPLLFGLCQRASVICKPGPLFVALLSFCCRSLSSLQERSKHISHQQRNPAINRQESIRRRCQRNLKRSRGCTLKRRLALVRPCSSTPSVLHRSSQSGTSTASEYDSRRAFPHADAGESESEGVGEKREERENERGRD